MALRMQSFAIWSRSSPALEYIARTQLHDVACEPSSLLHGNNNAFESSRQIV